MPLNTRSTSNLHTSAVEVYGALMRLDALNSYKFRYTTDAAGHGAPLTANIADLVAEMKAKNEQEKNVYVIDEKGHRIKLTLKRGVQDGDNEQIQIQTDLPEEHAQPSLLKSPSDSSVADLLRSISGAQTIQSAGQKHKFICPLRNDHGLDTTLGGPQKWDLYRSHLEVLFKIIKHLEQGYEDPNMLIALATGSGKTFIQAMWLLVQQHANMHAIMSLPDNLVSDYLKEIAHVVPDDIMEKIGRPIRNSEDSSEVAETDARLAALNDDNSPAQVIVASSHALFDKYTEQLMTLDPNRTLVSVDEQHLLKRKKLCSNMHAVCGRLMSMFLTATPNEQSYELCGKRTVASMSLKDKKQSIFPRIRKLRSKTVDQKRRLTPEKRRVKFFERLIKFMANQFYPELTSVAIDWIQDMERDVHLRTPSDPLYHKPNQNKGGFEGRNRGQLEQSWQAYQSMRWNIETSLGRKALIHCDDTNEAINLYRKLDPHQEKVSVDDYETNYYGYFDQLDAAPAEVAIYGGTGNAQPHNRVVNDVSFRLIDENTELSDINAYNRARVDQAKQFAQRAKGDLSNTGIMCSNEGTITSTDRDCPIVMPTSFSEQYRYVMHSNIIEFVLQDLTGLPKVEADRLRKENIVEYARLVREGIDKRIRSKPGRDYREKQQQYIDGIDESDTASLQHKMKKAGIDENGWILVRPLLERIVAKADSYAKGSNGSDEYLKFLQLIDNYPFAANNFPDKNSRVESERHAHAAFDAFYRHAAVVYIFRDKQAEGLERRAFCGFDESFGEIAKANDAQKTQFTTKLQERELTIYESVGRQELKQAIYEPRYIGETPEDSEKTASAYYRIFGSMLFGDTKTEGFSDLNNDLNATLITSNESPLNAPATETQAFGRLRGLGILQPIHYEGRKKGVHTAFDITKLEEENFYRDYFKGERAYKRFLIKSLSKKMLAELQQALTESTYGSGEVDTEKLRSETYRILIHNYRLLYDALGYQNLAKTKKEMNKVLKGMRKEAGKTMDKLYNGNLKKSFLLEVLAFVLYNVSRLKLYLLNRTVIKETKEQYKSTRNNARSIGEKLYYTINHTLSYKNMIKQKTILGLLLSESLAEQTALEDDLTRFLESDNKAICEQFFQLFLNPETAQMLEGLDFDHVFYAEFAQVAIKHLEKLGADNNYLPNTSEKRDLVHKLNHAIEIYQRKNPQVQLEPIKPDDICSNMASAIDINPKTILKAYLQSEGVADLAHFLAGETLTRAQGLLRDEDFVTAFTEALDERQLNDDGYVQTQLIQALQVKEPTTADLINAKHLNEVFRENLIPLLLKFVPEKEQVSLYQKAHQKEWLDFYINNQEAIQQLQDSEQHADLARLCLSELGYTGAYRTQDDIESAPSVIQLNLQKRSPLFAEQGRDSGKDKAKKMFSYVGGKLGANTDYAKLMKYMREEFAYDLEPVLNRGAFVDLYKGLKSAKDNTIEGILQALANIPHDADKTEKEILMAKAVQPVMPASKQLRFITRDIELLEEKTQDKSAFITDDVAQLNRFNDLFIPMIKRHMSPEALAQHADAIDTQCAADPAFFLRVISKPPFDKDGFDMNNPNAAHLLFILQQVNGLSAVDIDALDMNRPNEINAAIRTGIEEDGHVAAVQNMLLLFVPPSYRDELQKQLAEPEKRPHLIALTQALASSEQSKAGHAPLLLAFIMTHAELPQALHASLQNRYELYKAYDSGNFDKKIQARLNQQLHMRMRPLIQNPLYKGAIRRLLGPLTQEELTHLLDRQRQAYTTGPQSNLAAADMMEIYEDLLNLSEKDFLDKHMTLNTLDLGQIEAAVEQLPFSQFLISLGTVMQATQDAVNYHNNMNYDKEGRLNRQANRNKPRILSYTDTVTVRNTQGKAHDIEQSAAFIGFQGTKEATEAINAHGRYLKRDPLHRLERTMSTLIEPLIAQSNAKHTLLGKASKRKRLNARVRKATHLDYSETEAWDTTVKADSENLHNDLNQLQPQQSTDLSKRAADLDEFERPLVTYYSNQGRKARRELPSKPEAPHTGRKNKPDSP